VQVLAKLVHILQLIFKLSAYQTVKAGLWECHILTNQVSNVCLFMKQAESRDATHLNQVQNSIFKATDISIIPP
jgi:hypothetical protein